MGTRSVLAGLVVVPLLTTPTEATETVISASAGTIFGGFLNYPGDRFTFAGSVAVFGANDFGVELEGAYTPNDVFRNTEDSNITTFVASGAFRSPERRLRGHLTLGVGGVRSEYYRRNVGPWHVWAPCISGGLGALVSFSSHFGARGDLRYLVALENKGDQTDFDRMFGRVNFGRATAGLFARF
jgi:hypothetical protein